MKRMILIYAVLCSCMSFAQRNISGVYDDGEGRRLEVFNDKLLYVITLREKPWSPCPVAAEASFAWVNDDFIELHAENTKSKIDSALSIIQTYDPKQKNGIRVTFSMPDIWYHSFRVNIYGTTKSALGNGRKTRRQFKYRNNKVIKTFRFPSETNALSFKVTPLSNPISYYNEKNSYYISYINYSIPYFVLDDSINNVAITVRKLNIDYFGKTLDVNGEYVKIDGDKLIWRGRIYTKQYDEYSIEYIRKKELGQEAYRWTTWVVNIKDLEQK